MEGRGKERSGKGQVKLPKPQLLCLGARLEGMTGAQAPSLLEEAGCVSQSQSWGGATEAHSGLEGLAEGNAPRRVPR